MKKMILALSLLASVSAFAGEGNGDPFPFSAPPLGTSQPSSNVQTMTGSEGFPVTAPQQLTTPALDCKLAGVDGSGQQLVVCRNGGNR